MQQEAQELRKKLADTRDAHARDRQHLEQVKHTGTSKSDVESLEETQELEAAVPTNHDRKIELKEARVAGASCVHRVRISSG